MNVCSMILALFPQAGAQQGLAPPLVGSVEAYDLATGTLLTHPVSGERKDRIEIWMPPGFLLQATLVTPAGLLSVYGGGENEPPYFHLEPREPTGATSRATRAPGAFVAVGDLGPAFLLSAVYRDGFEDVRVWNGSRWETARPLPTVLPSGPPKPPPPEQAAPPLPGFDVVPAIVPPGCTMEDYVASYWNRFGCLVDIFICDSPFVGQNQFHTWSYACCPPGSSVLAPGNGDDLPPTCKTVDDGEKEQ